MNEKMARIERKSEKKVHSKEAVVLAIKFGSVVLDLITMKRRGLRTAV